VSEFSIAGRPIGQDHPPLVIAEIGINHEGSLDVAIDMADCAIEHGAEVIKHQTHVVSDEMSGEARRVIPGNADVSIYEIIERCALGEDDERALMQHIQSRGSIFISTPFSRAAADRLAGFGVPAFKIGSGECNNYPFIKYVANSGKPMIVSTGMNDIESVRPTVEIMRNAGVPFALLHCTNVYPTPPELVRLNAMSELARAYPDAVIGLSDHSLNNYPCIASVALGASILERHFTDSYSRPGPDISCSMDGPSLRELVDASQMIHVALGSGKAAVAEEAPTIAFAFASVAITKPVRVGEALTEDNIFPMRPAGGDFGVADYEGLIGRRAARDLRVNVQLRRGDVQ
jgi:N-acetylneuraminate synthase